MTDGPERPAVVDATTDAPATAEALARPARLAALHRMGLLDTEAEEAFDRLTRLAATLLRVPISLVSLVDVDRQFLKSARGLPEPWASRRQTPLDLSFCQYVVAAEAPLVVTDARAHPWLRDSLAIRELGVIAYAGHPIASPEGEVVGSMCAIDVQPREWTAAELDVLRELASLAHTELELRAALRESERASAERTAVIESSSDGIYAIDLTGRCTLANAAAAELLGFAREEMLGRNMHDLIHHHYADGTPFPESECPLFRSFREGRSIRVEDTALWRQDGTAFPADCTSSPLFVDGALTGAVVTFRDVTERRRTAEGTRLLSEAGALLASSLEYEGALRHVARLAVPQLGDACVVEVRRPDGSRDAWCAALDPAREDEYCALARADAVASAAASSPIVDVARSPELGGLRALGVRSLLRVPLRGARGEIGTLVFVARQRGHDAFDMGLAEALAVRATAAVENALLYRDAQAATRARDEVLAVVSHDLRNPVHTITMSASFLLELPALDEKLVRTQLEAIRRSAGRADRLIRDLMDVTRMEHGKLQLDRQPVGVAELVREAAQMAGTQARQREIALTADAPGDDVVLAADRHRLLQALDNLLGNALKFTPRGGRVTLAACAGAEGVRFEVRDTGPGVPLDQQANLFRRFWQARRVDRRGVGLGLSIVKGIVEAHGGHIAVESDGRSGTTIRFTIPYDAPREAAAPTA